MMNIFKDIFSKTGSRDTDLIKDISNYVSHRYDLLKVELLEKGTRIIAMFLSLLVIFICCVAVVLYLSFAMAKWVNMATESSTAGYFVVAGIFLIMLVLAIIYKERLFINPILRKLSEILYDDDLAEDDQDKDGAAGEDNI